MSRLLVKTFSISIDGYGAGLRQDLQNPLGVGGPELFDWVFHTRTWRQMHGLDAGETESTTTWPLRGSLASARGFWAQHVRSGPRRLARRELERVVGR